MNGDTGKFATLQTNSDKILKWIAKEEAKAEAKTEADTLAESQAASSQVEAEVALKRRVRAVTLTVLGTIATAGGGVYTWAAVGPPPDPVVEPRDVQDEVKSQGEEITDRIYNVEGGLEELREITVEQQVDLEAIEVQQVEGFEYIGELIQASPRDRGRIEVPESLKAAKRRKRDAAVRERLFGD